MLKNRVKRHRIFLGSYLGDNLSKVSFTNNMTHYSYSGNNCLQSSAITKITKDGKKLASRVCLSGKNNKYYSIQKF